STPIADIRWMGVLQRIALAYLGAGLVVLHVRLPGILLTTAVLVVGYALALTYIPLDGHRGSFAEGQNLADLVDARYLPGRPYLGNAWDPEGIVSTSGAIASCLLGVLAGLLFLNDRLRPSARVLLLLLIGVGLAAIGWYWGRHLPIIKKIWTPSFTLLSGGISIAALGLVHLVVDLLRLRFWIAPFLWIGENPLFLYLSSRLFDLKGIANRLAGGDVKEALGHWGLAVQALIPLGFILLVAWFLHRHRIRIRV
ncbi:MAG: DUF5009 domain-containing protein, partial [Planctomycetes bacterium]|nr:DUF5009 domain-containing protein [Planctomycetota bacterium]